MLRFSDVADYRHPCLIRYVDPDAARMDHATVIANQRITLAGGRYHRLGPGLIVRDCDILVDCTGNCLTVVHATFESCTVAITKRLTNYEWFGARFEDCVFTGEIVGLRFGSLPDDEIDSFGTVADCSFATSILHLTDFVNVDVSSIDFPRWPSFTIVSPSARDDLLALDWPGELRILAETIVESASEVTALSVYAPYAVQELGGDLATLKAVLDRAANVIM